MKTLLLILTALLLLPLGGTAQNRLDWGDQGDGTYKNPILNTDFSDPDVIRVGGKYYMIASDFHYMGMQVLESEDMVNWKYISQIYDRFPFTGWDQNTQYANGAWAPALRYHDGKFWMFVITPEEGLLMSNATDPHGPWSPLHCVKSVKRWEDPCPLWDDDGQAYLARSVHRAGPIIIHKMSPDGKQLLDEGKVVYRGPVAEGPKFLKRNGYYYILIPEGGVSTGWQTVLRSKHIYGPYESRRVLEQGSTNVNGPHQGALVDTPDGEWWFYHFQSKNPLGRVVHLQPARWTEDDWLEMGEDYDGNGIGEPVLTHRKPDIRFTKEEQATRPFTSPTKGAFLPYSASDDFQVTEGISYWAGGRQRPLGLQWQWCHNPADSQWSLTERSGWLTMHALPSDGLRMCRNMLTQKSMGYQSQATTRMDTRQLTDSTFAGLLYTGRQFYAIGATANGIYLEENGKREAVYKGKLGECVWFRTLIDNRTNTHRFLYSLDGKRFHPVGAPFSMKDGYWKGTRVGIFCYAFGKEAEGTAQFDYFEYEVTE